jgi:sarcosine oxidase delta subunit
MPGGADANNARAQNNNSHANTFFDWLSIRDRLATTIVPRFIPGKVCRKLLSIKRKIKLLAKTSA